MLPDPNLRFYLVGNDLLRSSAGGPRKDSSDRGSELQPARAGLAPHVYDVVKWGVGYGFRYT